MEVFTLLFLFYQEMLFNTSHRLEYTPCPIENYVTCDGMTSSSETGMLYKRPGVHTVRMGFFYDDRITTGRLGYLVGNQILTLNNSLEKSGVNIVIEPVFFEPVDVKSYFDKDIRPLFYSFENWQNESPWREKSNIVYEKRIDFIHLLLDNSIYWNACGVARKFTGENYPVGVTACYSRYDVASWDPDQTISTEHVLAHEVGHQFGLEHDRPNATGDAFIEGGYGFQDDPEYGTIMSYAKIRIPYFSNPDISVRGEVFGDETTNAVKALNTVAPKLSLNFEDNLLNK